MAKNKRAAKYVRNLAGLRWDDETYSRLEREAQRLSEQQGTPVTITHLVRKLVKEGLERVEVGNAD